MQPLDQVAAFPGGLDGLQLYVWQRVKWTKLSSREGRVFVSFTVDTTGHLLKLRIQKSLDPVHDQEALRVFRQMPLWKPASRQGKRQAQAMTIPVLFTEAARRDWGTANSKP